MSNDLDVVHEFVHEPALHEGVAEQIERLTESALQTSRQVDLGEDLLLEGGTLVPRVVAERRALVHPTPIQTESLASIGEFLEHTPKLVGPLYAHVSSPVNVHLLSDVRDDGTRDDYMHAHWPMDPLEGFFGVEELRQEILACTSDTDDRKMLVQLLAKVTRASEVIDTDDGFGQEVAAKSGTRTEFKQAPRDFELHCHVSFPEVGPVLIPYRLRFVPGTDMALQVRMIVADGGKWRSEARGYVAEYLDEQLSPDDRVVVLR